MVLVVVMCLPAGVHTVGVQLYIHGHVEIIICSMKH